MVEICKSHYIMKRKKLKEKMIKEQNKKWLNPRNGGEVEYSSEDEDEAYCTRCGLVTSASIRYVAGKKIDLPYGIRL